MGSHLFAILVATQQTIRANVNAHLTEVDFFFKPKHHYLSNDI